LYGPIIMTDLSGPLARCHYFLQLIIPSLNTYIYHVYFDRLSSLTLEVETVNYKDSRYTLLSDVVVFISPYFYTGFHDRFRT
jgi:hypothetical protein